MYKTTRAYICGNSKVSFKAAQLLCDVEMVVW